jgi:hypothetical protein
VHGEGGGAGVPTVELPTVHEAEVQLNSLGGRKALLAKRHAADTRLKDQARVKFAAVRAGDWGSGVLKLSSKQRDVMAGHVPADEGEEDVPAAAATGQKRKEREGVGWDDSDSSESSEEGDISEDEGGGADEEVVVGDDD